MIEHNIAIELLRLAILVYTYGEKFTLKENETIVSNNISKASSKEVKKISIKYSRGPRSAIQGTHKKTKREKKTTLIESADDTDSSEFIMK